VEEIMNLLRDLTITAGDALRLASDLVRYKIEQQKKTVKRGASRIGVCLAVGLVALGFLGAGIGLLIYGSYVMVANQLGPGPSGMIIGAACMLLAGLMMLLACGAVAKS
jgi:hypothetical protein